MTTRDTPEAAAKLAEVIWDTSDGHDEVPWIDLPEQEQAERIEWATAILAALDGWTLVPNEFATTAWAPGDVRDSQAEAVAAERERIAEAVRGLWLPSNWSRFRGGALWDECIAAVLALVEP